MTAGPRRPSCFWLGATAILLIFTALLAVRLGIWHGQTAGTAPPAAPLQAEAQDAWMAIYQDADQIGYSHRRFQPTAEGFRLADDTFMRVNAMGMIQEVRLRTVARLRQDMSLAAFDFRLRSGRFAFEAQGTVEGSTLRVTVDRRKSEIALDGPIHLASGILNGLRFDTPETRAPRTFQVFDPTTLSRRPFTLTPLAEETIVVMGQPTATHKLKIEFAGATGLAWIDHHGRVVREKGLMGIELHRSTREETLAGVSAHPGTDLTDLASVPVDQTIDAPEALDRLQLRVAGLEVTAEGKTPFPHIDGRQTFADGLLTVTREAVPDPVVFAIGDQARYLEPSALIQSEDPRIRAAAAGVVADTDHPAARARQLVAWVYASLEKRPVLSVPSAVEVLERRMGDCNEHAVLLAALCRAAGIPARIEAGLVYQRGAFYYHAWNSVWLGRWVTADALMNQLPADVTHLSLAGGELAEAVDLISVIGRIRLAVVDRR